MLSVTSGYRSMPEDAFASPALFLLLANKADLTAAVDSRKGAKLADSYGAEFAGIMPYQERNLHPFVQLHLKSFRGQRCNGLEGGGDIGSIDYESLQQTASGTGTVKLRIYR